MAKFLDGISPLLDQYDHFILDIFGVLHNGIERFPGTVRALQSLKEAGKQICLLSNTPKRAEPTKAQLEMMGIPRNLYDYVVTSGEATHLALKHREDEFHQSCGDQCWFIGAGFILQMLEGLDLDLLDGPDGASFILNAAPGADDGYEKSLEGPLKRAAAMNLPMICSNPDLVVNIGADQYLCAGTYAKLYGEMGGRVLYHGKPHAPVYQRCYDYFGQPDKGKIIVIGDSFHTDITGAQRFGIDCVFNLTGIHWEEIALDHAPEEADMNKVMAMVERQDHTPNFVMNGLSV